MSTYSESINCPNCNYQNCERSIDCKTTEELIFCAKCGYKYEFVWKRDDEDKFILKDKSKEISPDNLFPEITVVENPFGVRIIERTDGVQELGTIKDSADYSAFINYIKKIKRSKYIKQIIIRKFVNGKFIEQKL